MADCCEILKTKRKKEKPIYIEEKKGVQPLGATVFSVVALSGASVSFLYGAWAPAAVLLCTSIACIVVLLFSIARRKASSKGE